MSSSYPPVNPPMPPTPSGSSGPGAGQAPTCPRHPDVVAYVRCSRCGRPACPQCQRQAAVGIHCVDCVRESARTAPRARNPLGGSASALSIGGGTPATTILVALCVVVYFLQLIVPGLERALWFAPYAGRDEPWRFVTAAFLHGGITHILFNMLALWTVGQPLERAMGIARFVALFLVSAIGGSVGYLLIAQATASPGQVLTQWQMSWFQPTVGASGAVFGLFAAELVLARRQGRDLRAMLIFLGLNLVIGFTVPNIAWQAHLGGFVTGAALASVMWATRSRERQRWQWPGVAAVLAILVALAVLKYALSPQLTGYVVGGA
ncbi:rhomboid family intramembrane serine protease [Arsenicicoccus bolidensis]|uniref:rhomboid family intramembrane serine protease n=1 Tax=Arsenicicoccus bolidensis TaxID=229480 RepID=UPI0028A824F7|nr:rhomboid family intramembrane serine protease [Arsenicicoccus bolidensis]